MISSAARRASSLQTSHQDGDVQRHANLHPASSGRLWMIAGAAQQVVSQAEIGVAKMRPHSRDETTVGMAHGTRIAARTPSSQRELLGEHERDDQPDQRLQRHRGNREVGRVAPGVPEAGIAERFGSSAGR